MTKLTQEQIDNYHSDRMSESEMADFEKTLESDPAIKAESDLQSDVVEGLKEYRRLELKSRLDAINIGPTWIEFVQQSTLMKSFGGVIIASLVGTGIYFYGERSELLDSRYPATVEVSEIESIDFMWDLGQEKETTPSSNLDKPQQVVEASANDEEIVKKETTIAKTNTELEEEVFKPSFEAPSVESGEDDADFSTTGLDEIPNSVENTSSDQAIDVQTEITKSSIIKYKYYDGKLFLNGDFDKAPYEILEINSTSGKRIYVYYLGSYYKVENTDKLTELPLVKNSEVIGELKLLRENK